MDEFLNAIYKINSKISTICYAHPTDLMNLDMNNFDEDTYFISNFNCEEGKVVIVTDEELKFELYKFCINHKDRIFQGSRCEDEDRN